jgi:putative membrane protein
MRRLALPLALLFALRCSPEQHAHPVPRSSAPKGPVLASQDRDFLERAAEGNKAEVAIGTLVHGRALRPEVVQLGDMVRTDHKAANDQLAMLAARHGIALPTSLGDHQAAFDQVVDEKGEPFDSDFVKVMIEDHQQAVRLYRGALASVVDPGLRAYAAATLPKIEAHLAHAIGLANVAKSPQEGTLPPTPDAQQLPPRSTVHPKP